MNWCLSFQSDHFSQLRQLFPSFLPSLLSLPPGRSTHSALPAWAPRPGPEGGAAAARHPHPGARTPWSLGRRLPRERDLCAARTLGRGRRSSVAVRRGDLEGAAAAGQRGGVSTS